MYPFYFLRSEALKKKKTVREKTARLLALAQGRKRALIFMQDNPDPDAIASALALARLLKNRAKVNATITYSGVIRRAENQAMVEQLEIPLVSFKEIDRASYDLTALVDSQPGNGNSRLPEGFVPDIVIDHHPRKPATRKAAFSDICTRLGATSTILTEYLFEEDIEISSRLATALAYGISTDTRNLSREATRRDIAAYRHIFHLANQRLLARIEDEKVPRAYFRAMAEAMRNATIYEDVIVTGLGRTENPDMVSEVADLLLRMEGIRCVLCFGFFEDNVLLSIRTHEDDLNAGKLAQKMIKRGKYLSENGTAGGHGMMAGGQVGIAGKNEKEIEKISTEIRHCFLEALGVGKRSRRTLIKNN